MNDRRPKQGSNEEPLDIRQDIADDKAFVNRQPDSTVYDTNPGEVTDWLNSTKGGMRGKR